MDDQKEENPSQSLSNNNKFAEGNALDISDFKIHSFIEDEKPGRRFILNFKQLETPEILIQELFLGSSHHVGSRIPKHLVSLDEKYLRRCLEEIHINASKHTLCGAPMNPLDVGFILGRLSPLEILRSSVEMDKFVLMSAGCGNIVISPVGRRIVGSVVRGNNTMNILKNPFYLQLRDFDKDAMLGSPSLFINKRLVPSDFRGFSSRLHLSSSKKHGKDMLIISNYGEKDKTIHRIPTRATSAFSPFTTNQFSAAAASVAPSDYQGMLQCRWNDGVPYFTFSVDDQEEVYVANASRVGLLDNNPLDYVYLFNLRPDGQKEYGNPHRASDVVVGKMRVSTSVSLGSNNSRVQETEFVLFGVNENLVVEMRTSLPAGRKVRKLSKVMEVLTGGHSVKHRRPSKFSGMSMSAVLGNCSSDRGQDSCSSLVLLEDGSNFLESHLPPNLELAAVVVRDYIHDDDDNIHGKGVGGGWGLKFLQKAGTKELASSECSQRKAGNCFTSMDIIVPAGVHGGPRTRNGGPSSLIDRWRFGGNCDCGGWDVGCPLTLLGPATRKGDGFLRSETQWQCESFEIFRQGSTHGMPMLKMVNIHDGLHLIEFQATLSPLQCFSIAVAIIHSRSPTLQPERVQL